MFLVASGPFAIMYRKLGMKLKGREIEPLGKHLDPAITEARDLPINSAVVLPKIFPPLC